MSCIQFGNRVRVPRVRNRLYRSKGTTGRNHKRGLAGRCEPGLCPDLNVCGPILVYANSHDGHGTVRGRRLRASVNG